MEVNEGKETLLSVRTLIPLDVIHACVMQQINRNSKSIGKVCNKVHEVIFFARYFNRRMHLNLRKYMRN